MSRSQEDTQIECFRLIHTLNKKVLFLEKEVKRMRAVVEGEETLAMEKEKQLQYKETVLGINRDQLKDRSSYKPLSDLAKTLLDAKIQFDRLDGNGNGVLESLEILELADWCWEQFGRKIRRRDKIRMTDELLEKTDKNQDGKIDFDEFAEWFVATINEFKRREKEKAQLQTFDESSEDEDEDGEAQITNNLSPRAQLIREHKQQTWQSAAKHADKKHQKNKKTPRNVHGSSSITRDQKQSASPSMSSDLEPWQLIAGGSKLSRSRVQLFLRINTHKDNEKNTLGQQDLDDLLARCNVKAKDIPNMSAKFCKYFGSNQNDQVTFKQFESKLENNANEKDLYEIVQKLYSQPSQQILLNQVSNLWS